MRLERLCAVVVAGVVLCTPALADAERELEQVFRLEPQETVAVSLRSGALQIEAGEVGHEVRARVTARCRRPSARCERRLARLRLAGHHGPDGLAVSLQGGSKWRTRGIDLRATLRVPASHPLAVEMDVGDLDVRGVERDLEVRVGIGDVRLHVPRAAVHRVALASGIGSAELYAPDALAYDRLAGARDRVWWEQGPGEADVLVDLAIGDISVRLQ